MKKRICIVTCAILGVPEDNEQGEYTSNLAISLASSGYEVSILLANGLSSEYRDKITTIKAFCAGKNIKLFFLMQVNEDYFSYALKTDNLINSYQVYEWFKKHEQFDIVFFADNAGVGFYSLLAKHQGLIFEKTKVFLKVFNTLRQRLFMNKINFDSIYYITDDFIEKKTIELCDVLLCSSKEIIDYIISMRWKIPEKVEILRDITYKQNFDSANNVIYAHTIFSDNLVKIETKIQDGAEVEVGKGLIKLIEDPPCIKDDYEGGQSFVPKVSVCLTHHERPHLLKYAIDSLRKQDYSNFEVILVDDGSKDEESNRYLNSLSDEFKQRGWKIIRQENLYPGAARNRGAKESSGEYIMFLDDDDYLKPCAISTFIGAVICSCADVLTCFNKIFDSESEPDKNNIRKISIFTGDIAAGIFNNSFGPITGFFKKSLFLETGGFNELKGVGYEDWEIYAKLSLRGYIIEVIPEILFYYRILERDKSSMTKSTDTFYNDQRISSVYVDGFDENMASALMYLKNAKNIGYRFDYLNNYIILLKQALKEKYGIVIT